MESQEKREHSEPYLMRFSPADMVKFRADADARGLSFAEWIRHCLREGGKGRMVPSSAGVGKARVSGGDAPRRQVRVDEMQDRPSTTRVPEVPSSLTFKEERERARELASKLGKCTADVERGMRCRLCGQKH